MSHTPERLHDTHDSKSTRHELQVIRALHHAGSNQRDEALVSLYQCFKRALGFWASPSTLELRNPVFAFRSLRDVCAAARHYDPVRDCKL